MSRFARMFRAFQVSRLIAVMSRMSDAELSRIGVSRAGIAERARSIVGA